MGWGVGCTYSFWEAESFGEGRGGREVRELWEGEFPPLCMSICIHL